MARRDPDEPNVLRGRHLAGLARGGRPGIASARRRTRRALASPAQQPASKKSVQQTANGGRSPEHAYEEI
jgi:hypothetical protein